MASVSASHLIIFIASMMIAASVAGVFTDSVGQLSNALSEQGLDVSKDVRTDVEIISDAGSSAIYDGSTVTIHVKNTGTERLAPVPEQLDIFVNGTFMTDYTVTLEPDGGASWQPGSVVRVDVAVGAMATGDHRVKVIVNGDEEVLRFSL